MTASAALTKPKTPTEAQRFNQLYATRASNFYLKAIGADTPENPKVKSPFGGKSPFGKPSLFQRAIGQVIEERRSHWDKLLSKMGTDGDEESSKRWATLRGTFNKYTREALETEDPSRKASKAAALESNAEKLEKRKAMMAARQKARAEGVGATSSSPALEQPADGTLRAQFRSFWNEKSSPTWGKRSNHAWGGVGWSYSISDGEGAKLKRGWERQMDAVSMAFDERHEHYVSRAQKLMQQQGHRITDSTAIRRNLDQHMFGLRSNRFTVQPLRLDASAICGPQSPHSKYRAAGEYSLPLALAGGSGGSGPLVPVFERPFETGVYAEEQEEHDNEAEEGPAEWTLFASIWGPRCVSCDGNDFVDHEDIIFERFVSDWQAVLRLGVAKMIARNDDDGLEDDDGDGVPDEVEDVGAVLFINHQLITLAYLWYADTLYASGMDLESGIKLNQGWKAFCDDCHIWKHMSEKDAACANSLIFMEVDKVDRATIAAIAAESQDVYQARRATGLSGLSVTEQAGRQVDEEAATAAQTAGLKRASQTALAGASLQAFGKKSDNQLNRVEFQLALVKTAIERFIRSKETSDVSDALERLFSEFILPALEQPLPCHVEPKLPQPDTFRVAVCYPQAMSEALGGGAPSLRVMFAGLAKITFETARSTGVKLPKLAENKTIQRDGAKWIKVHGIISYVFWKRFVEALFPTSIDLRKTALCFLHSAMAVMDGNTEEGRIKETHLPFEGFLEAIVRLATTLPLPTDEQLAASEIRYAGPFMDAIDSDDALSTEIRVDYARSAAAAHACEWGGVPDAMLAGNMPRRVTHLVDVIVRRVQNSKNADVPLTSLTRREFRLWAVPNLLGGSAPAGALPEKWTEAKAVGESPPGKHIGIFG